MKRLILVALAVLLVACGKRGDPRPPVPVIPQAVSDLVVTQQPARIVLTWSYPSLTTAGRPLTGIRRIHVYRYIEQAPVSPTGRDPQVLVPAAADPNVPAPVALFSTLPTLSPVQFARLRERVTSIEEANLAGATVGSKLVFEDEPSFHAADGRPVRITYAVVTEGHDARSDLSNLATIVPLDVAVPPPSLTAAPGAAGVVLTWSAPESAAAGGDARPIVTGYNVYRTAAGQPFEALASPINTAPVTATTYTDTPSYGDWEYRVTAVASDAPRIESDPSAVVAATFKDLVAPPPPKNVTALAETKQVRLIWEAVDAADLSGYNVYRTEQGTRLRLAFRVTQPQFSDISIQPGTTYTYQVSSLDANGNESEVTNSQPILVPRTP